VHGGPDAKGAAPHDFSTNANACGPCPLALQAVQGADAQRYPDPTACALREALGRLHGVPPQRIVVAASASEFIFRMTAAAAQRGGRAVAVPPHAYGDYAAAARAWGMEVVRRGRSAGLAWACEPSSPLGQGDACAEPVTGTTLVVDLAYAPLRLGGTASPLPPGAWQLWSPNKALGLTGVRGAYAVAPEGTQEMVGQLQALAPSWVLGAHGAAMLRAWGEAAVQAWVEGCKPTLREWKKRQAALCRGVGWEVLPSDANFFTARASLDAAALQALRLRGVQLRDCSSFGLPGHVRLAVLPPASQDALQRALEALR